MNRAWTTVALAAALSAAADAEPRIYRGGVMNAAGLAPQGLPGSAIARGALITILGEDLGAPDLSSVSVTVIDSRGTRHAADPIFARAGQINARMPCPVAVGDTRVEVSVSGRAGPPSEPFQTVSQNFQMFTRTHKGWGPAAAKHFSASGDIVFNSVLTAAVPGQVMSVWGTGMGSCEEPVHASDIQIWVGEKPAPFLGHQDSAHEPGVDEISFQIPNDAPEGCYVPVVVRAGHGYSNIGSVAISRSGGVCNDKVNGFTLLTPRLLDRDVSWGRIQLFRGATVTERPGILSFVTGSEQGEAGFLRSDVASLDDGFHYPPAGACLVMPYGSGTAISNQSAAALGAGDVSVIGPWEVSFQLDAAAGIYRRRLSPTPFEGRSGDFIRPNTTYTVVGHGGPQVGPFQASVTIPGFLEWTNRDHMPFALQRHEPITVKWSGGDAQREFVAIRGFSFDRETSLGRDFICTERVDARGFTLPESVVASLPRSTLDLFVSVGNMPLLAAPNFHAHGIDYGFLTYEIATGKNFSLR